MFADQYVKALDNNENDLFWKGIIELTYRNIDLRKELASYTSDDEAYNLMVKSSILGILDEIEYWKSLRYEVYENCFTKETMDELIKQGEDLGIPKMILRGASMYYANEALTKELERRKHMRRDENTNISE
ncbi:MAG: hypothetical protein ABSG94_12230 [Brevinematales bacterium]|jgi:hypothetical protein